MDGENKNSDIKIITNHTVQYKRTFKDALHVVKQLLSLPDPQPVFVEYTENLAYNHVVPHLWMITAETESDFHVSIMI